MVSKNKCRLCGEPLPKNAEGIGIEYCAGCVIEAADALLDCIAERFDVEGEEGIQLVIGLFQQAVKVLYYLLEWPSQTSEEKRCLS